MGSNDKTAILAAAILEFRRARCDMLPADLFAEPAWDLLLELFVADAEGRRISGREVSQRAGIAPTVMARWLMHLSKIGFVIGDGNGDLDDLLTLSGEGMDRMERTMLRASALEKAIG